MASDLPRKGSRWLAMVVGVAALAAVAVAEFGFGIRLGCR